MRIFSGGAQRLRLAAAEFIRSNIRFVDTASVTWTLTDDPAQDEIEVQATATGAGGGITDFTYTGNVV